MRTLTVGVGFLAAASVVQLVYVTRPAWFLNQHVVVTDDTYYYLQVAKNVARLGWATFDGIHATNGVQFLWAAVVSGLAMVFDDRMALVRAVLLCSVVLNLATGLILRRFGTVIHSGALGEVAAVLWGVLMLWSGTMLTGMEYSIHSFVVAALLLCWWRVMTESPVSPPRTIAVSVMATLMFWARIDAAIFVLAIMVSVTVRLLGTDAPRWRKDLARLWLLPAAGAVAYVVLSRAMAGTLLPVSGLVKRVYAAEHFEGYPWWVALAGHVYWWGKVQVQPVMDVTAALFARRVGVISPPPVVALAGALALAVTVWGAINVWSAGDDRMKRAASWVFTLWLLAALHSAILVAQIGHFSHSTKLYYGWLMMTWIVWLAMVLMLAGRKIRRTSNAPAVAVLVTALVVVQGAGVTKRLRGGPQPSDLRNARTELAGWLEENLPPGEPIGAWNAGQLGYFLDRPVVNLDGLVNDRDFLEVVRRGEPIVAYLEREGIEYVVDYNDIDLTMPYRASWDRGLLFRNEIPWGDVDRLLERHAEGRTIHVLRLRNDRTP